MIKSLGILKFSRDKVFLRKNNFFLILNILINSNFF